MTIQESISIMTELTRKFPGIRFVGSIVGVYNGVTEEISDIDVIVDDVSIFANHIVEQWENVTPFTSNGVRAYVNYGDYTLDVFQKTPIEDVNEYDLKDPDFTIQTLDNWGDYLEYLILEYRKLYPTTLERGDYPLVSKFKSQLLKIQNL